MTTNRSIAEIIRSIDRCADIDFDDACCELEPITDAIIIAADNIEQNDADTMMMLARRIDPTESNFAAEIRDTIRNNTELNT